LDHLEEDALLGIHRFGFARADAEEPGVEHLDVVEHPSGGDEALMVQEGRRDAVVEQLLPRQACNAVAPVAQIAPEGVDRFRLGKTTGHADDRNSFAPPRPVRR
jgi:hypothetical protein